MHALLRFLVTTLISFSNQLHQKKKYLKILINRVACKSVTLESVVTSCSESFHLISGDHKFITVPAFWKNGLQKRKKN